MYQNDTVLALAKSIYQSYGEQLPTFKNSFRSVEKIGQGEDF